MQLGLAVLQIWLECPRHSPARSAIERPVSATRSDAGRPARTATVVRTCGRVRLSAAARQHHVVKHDLAAKSNCYQRCRQE